MAESALSPQLQRGLSDKLYERRKAAALEIEKLVRDAAATPDKVKPLIDALIHDFVYSVQPNAKNGGLIGLAAATIALGQNITPYLPDVVPPVLYCFGDQDSRVRYYACESMYNICKVAKGEILRFFNDVFDAMCKLAADSELTVKNGAELLDRLLKDIVSEYSTTYISPNMLPLNPAEKPDPDDIPPSLPRNTAFSLSRFIPLLAERIYTQNAFTRQFLVSWIQVLDSIPDLELVSFLPEFLDGLIKFLSDPNEEVRVATGVVLADFLREIRQAAKIRQHRPDAHDMKRPSNAVESRAENGEDAEVAQAQDTTSTIDEQDVSTGKGDWLPGQGVIVKYDDIVSILMPHLSSTDQETQNTALRWINHFISIAKDIMLHFTPQLISAILPSLAHETNTIRIIAIEANSNLQKLVYNTPLSDDTTRSYALPADAGTSAFATKADVSTGRSSAQQDTELTSAKEDPFDYNATVAALTLQFLNEHEETRTASLDWLLMLHKKAPYKILASDDGTFPVLLKTLSDPSEEASSQTLQSERIYRSLAEILEKDEDLEFASIMVQNLNIILVTSPELAELRKRLKNLESKDGQILFTALYKSWCHNAVATFALCLLAQAYEHAASLLQTFAELEITVNFLIQIDKLVQLLESPVFTYLRLQLLEPDKYPYLYKCLYGLLMLLPQSSAFATLRNRLNSVSSLGFFHVMPRTTAQLDPTKRKTGTIKVDDPGVRWDSLLNHFRQVQSKHEKSRKQALQDLTRSTTTRRRSKQSSTPVNSTPSSKPSTGNAMDRQGSGGASSWSNQSSNAMSPNNSMGGLGMGMGIALPGGVGNVMGGMRNNVPSPVNARRVPRRK
ncbi:hypothetical protein BZG36_00950 [Bifiguratus adelaidae]|uniref:Vacuolar protein 14 C-terminal Fig4-binding domain-containing protein n=1 Tax=Bifiguratus adelaidae TaxID=1938954 RepID=A0A261Y5D9_9FUNG|nr:hypothetical protein BZG36_00950 [Bifiguratus adelaidae]